MKCLFSADIHFHNWSDFATINSDGINSRLADILRVFDQMVAEAKKQDCSHMYLIGDIFHSRTTLDTDLVAVVSKKFQEVSDEGIEISILLGNHDISASNKDINMLSIFKKYCKIIEKPCKHNFTDTCEFYNLPYIADKIELQKHIRRLKELAKDSDCNKILLSHNGLSLASIGPTEFKIEDPVSVNDLGPELFDLCLFGHYHKPQQLADNVFYVGSPIQHNFGERNDTKSFWIVDTNTMQYELIKTDAPRFVQCSPEKAIEEKAKGNYVQIEVKDKEEAVFLEKNPELKSFNVIDSVKTEEESKSRMTLEKNTKITDAAEAYIQYKEVEELDHEILLKIAVEALEEADDN